MNVSSSAAMVSCLLALATPACTRTSELPDASASPTPAPPPAKPTPPAKAEPNPPAAPKLSGLVEAKPEDALRLEQSLRALVKEGASEDGFPWALAHGLLAFGADLRTDEDRLAIDAIGSHLEPVARGGRTVYTWPAKTKADLPVEAHPGAILLSIVSSGVPSDRTLVASDGKKIAVKQLVDDAAWSFVLPRTAPDWHRFAWNARLLLTQSGVSAKVETVGGPLGLRDVAEAALAQVEKEQSFLLEPMRNNRPEDVQKRRQAIFSHTCGGLHFVQAGLTSAGFLDGSGRTRARTQLDILKFRWLAERRIYRDKIAQHPDYAPLLLVQELKFFGHTLETYALAAKEGQFTPTPEDKSFFRAVTQDLRRTVKQLEPIYAAQDALRRASAQTYYDLIGDGCHAIRALALGRPLFFPSEKPKHP